MSDEIIIQQLKERELHLVNELNKVRLALQAFINENIGLAIGKLNSEYPNESVPRRFEKSLTYGAKVLYVLSTSKRPMLVDEIVQELHQLEPELELNRLHKSVSHNLSMLAKYANVKKHAFSRKIKYSL